MTMFISDKSNKDWNTYIKDHTDMYTHDIILPAKELEELVRVAFMFHEEAQFVRLTINRLADMKEGISAILDKLQNHNMVQKQDKQ